MIDFNFDLSGGAVLAPMAGITDLAFRTLCGDFGASGTYTEMASIKALVMSDKKTKQLLTIGDNHRPCGIQLFGDDPEYFTKAVDIIAEFEPDFVDINMGCPAPKIVNNGGGSALMKDPKLCGDIVRATCIKSKVPVTVKIRAGYTPDTINAVEVAKIAEENGASMITVHGRTRDQMYHPPVNLDIISQVKNAVSIPVMGNGDVTDINSYINMKKTTGCDFVMIGRGALGNPFIFRQIQHYLNTGEILPDMTIQEKMKILKQQCILTMADKGDIIGMKEMRKHAAWYVKGIKGAASLRNSCGKLCTLDDIDRLTELVLSHAQEME